MELVQIGGRDGSGNAAGFLVRFLVRFLVDKKCIFFVLLFVA